VEEFLDTPVKRYSSGMKVRLAFAVAAHLDPDILIVDEVLAVGDASFQQKCIGKIDSSAKEGRTILFVSHNASAVEALCRRGIVLEAGGVIFDGTQTEALSFYAERGSAMMKPVSERTDHRGKGGVRIRALRLLGKDGREGTVFPSGHDLTVEFDFESEDNKTYTGVAMELSVSTLFETKIFHQSTKLTGVNLDPFPLKGTIRCRIPRLPLTSSSYKISYRLLANSGHLALDALDAAAEFHVEGGDFFGTGQLPPAGRGPFLVDADWSIE
jgi:lipopolysaccharide transport system ATP-binding protein